MNSKEIAYKFRKKYVLNEKLNIDFEMSRKAELALLGKYYYITRLRGNDYILEWNQWNEEYTVKELVTIEKKLLSVSKKLPKELKVGNKTASVYVRDGDVTIGIDIKSSIKHSELESILGFYITERS